MEAAPDCAARVPGAGAAAVISRDDRLLQQLRLLTWLCCRRTVWARPEAGCLQCQSAAREAAPRGAGERRP